MAENGVNGHQRSMGMQWKVGLMNSANKYMTAETFGFKANVSGTAMKKKQLWTLEQDPVNNWIYIRSHLGRYLSADRLGNVRVDADPEEEEIGDDQKFVVEYNSDGRWTFKNIKHKIYLKGNKDELKCQEKAPTEENWWSIQLNVHPQVNLRNVNRKSFAHFNKDTGELECSEEIPWGEDSLITLDFTSKGKYTMKASNNCFLNREGGLDDKPEPDSDNMFTMEIHQGCLTFKDSAGRYLTAVAKGSMKARNKTVTKDELFTIEESHPQAHIISYNDKCVSVRQGIDISANQNPDPQHMCDTEIFQLEYVKNVDAWAIRTSKGTYWCLQPGAAGSVQAQKKTLTKDCYFKLEWLENGKMAIKGPDGKYLSNKKTGVLFSATDSLEDGNKFTCNLVNRPLLVLKSDYGFVGVKGNKYVCNTPNYDALKVEPTLKGSYRLKGADDKYLGIDDDNNLTTADGPSDFFFEFHGQSMMAILTTSGKYIKGEQNGLFRAIGSEIESSTLFEY